MIHQDGGGTKDFAKMSPKIDNQRSFWAIIIAIFVAVCLSVWYISARDSAASSGRVPLGSRLDSATYGKVDSLLETRYYAVDIFVDTIKYSKIEIRRGLTPVEWKSLKIVR